MPARAMHHTATLLKCGKCFPAKATLALPSARAVYLIDLLLLAAPLLVGVAVFGEEGTTLIRSGVYHEISDVTAGGYRILDLSMSGDGEWVVFRTQQNGENTQALRLMRTDGTEEALLFSGPVFDIPLLYATYGISDDGARVVYAVGEDSYAHPADTIRVYDRASGVTQEVLSKVSHTSYGETALYDLNLLAGRAQFALSGDGGTAVFVNRFGPYGSSTDPEAPPPSGFTVYAVHVPDGAYLPLLEASGLQDIPGISTSAVEVTASGGVLAIDYAGTVVAIPVGGNYPSANPPKSLLLKDPRTPVGDARVLLDIAGMNFQGPSLSDDGSMIAFCRWGGTAPSPQGLLTAAIADIANTVLVDPGVPSAGRWPTDPVLSGDGSATSHQFDIGGGSNPTIRWASADGAGVVPLSRAGFTTGGRYSALSNDGKRVLFVGGIKHGSDNPPGNLLRLDFTSGGEAPVGPAVTQLTGEPRTTLIRQVRSSAQVVNTWFYRATGANLTRIYPFSYDPVSGVDPGGLGGDDNVGLRHL